MEFLSFDKLNISKNYLHNFINENINNKNIINATNLIDYNLINQLKTFLIQKGYNCKNNEYYVEIHNQNNLNYKNKFPLHVDSNGPIPGNVVTFIYYYYFTPNIEGGNLIIQDYHKYKWWFLEYKKYYLKTINVWTEEHKNRFVFMKENLYHKAENIYSTTDFQRIFLTIFIKI